MPLGIASFDGVIAMETRAGVTVRNEQDELPGNTAQMVELPNASGVASPELLMVATVVLDELQVTDDVRF